MAGVAGYAVSSLALGHAQVVRRLGIPDAIQPNREPIPKPEPRKVEPKRASPTELVSTPEPVEPTPVVLAWSAYGNEDHEAALSFFAEAAEAEPVDAAYGSSLSHLALEQFALAVHFARLGLAVEDVSTEARRDLESVLGYALMGRAYAAQANGNDRAARSFAEAAVKYEVSASDAAGLIARLDLDHVRQSYARGEFAQVLEQLDTLPLDEARKTEFQRIAAWSYFEQEDFEESSALFARLYDQSQSESDATGLYYSAQRLDRVEKLGISADDDSSPLGQLYRHDLGADAFYRGDYLRAYKYGAPQSEKLAGVDKGWVAARTHGRRVDGAEGRDQLNVVSLDVSAGRPVDLNQFDATLSFSDVKNGVNQFGQSVMVPRASWRRDGNVSYSAKIATTPIGADAAIAPLAEVGVEKVTADGGVAAGLYARSRNESLLSWVGTTSSDGRTTGRVVAKGIEVEGRKALSKLWSLSARANAEHVDGLSTIENTGLGAQFQIGRSLFADKFDYFTIGPFARVQSYTDNTNFYSFGHGGYFSPDLFAQAGGFLSFRTPQLKKEIFEVSAELGFEYVRTDDAFENPLTQSGLLFAGDEDTGISGSARFSYLRLVDNHWFVGAEFGVTQSAAFQDVRAGLRVRRAFGHRVAATSRDRRPYSEYQGLGR